MFVFVHKVPIRKRRENEFIMYLQSKYGDKLDKILNEEMWGI